MFYKLLLVSCGMYISHWIQGGALFCISDYGVPVS